jgi:hypothetical protein
MAGTVAEEKTVGALHSPGEFNALINASFFHAVGMVATVEMVAKAAKAEELFV